MNPQYCCSGNWLRVVFSAELFSSQILGREEEVIVYVVEWICQWIFHFMRTHTHIYSNRSSLTDFMFIFYQTDENIRWRKFCFAPKIWGKHLERRSETQSECEKSDLSVFNHLLNHGLWILHNLLKEIMALLSHKGKALAETEEWVTVLSWNVSTNAPDTTPSERVQCEAIHSRVICTSKRHKVRFQEHRLE